MVPIVGEFASLDLATAGFELVIPGFELVILR
jgi:hypothetical protein